LSSESTNGPLDPQKTYELADLASEVRETLKTGDKSVLEEKVKKLEAALVLPQFIFDILDITGAVQSRIHPVDPIKADEFENELTQIENEMKSGNSLPAPN